MLLTCDQCRASKVSCKRVENLRKCEKCLKRHSECSYNGKQYRIAQIEQELGQGGGGYDQWQGQQRGTTNVYTSTGAGNSEFVQKYQEVDASRQDLDLIGPLGLGRGMKRLIWDAYNTHLRKHLDIVGDDIESEPLLLQASVYAVTSRMTDVPHSLLDFAHLRKYINHQLDVAATQPIISLSDLVALVLCHTTLEIHTTSFACTDRLIFHYLLMTRGCVQLGLQALSTPSPQASILFYAIVILDRWMGVCTGAPVAIRDEDITTPLPVESAASPFFMGMIHVSLLVGRVRAHFYDNPHANATLLQQDEVFQALLADYPDAYYHCNSQEQFFIRVHRDTALALFVIADLRDTHNITQSKHQQEMVDNALFALTQWDDELFYSPCMMFSTIYYCFTRALMVAVDSLSLPDPVNRQSAQQAVDGVENLLYKMETLDDGLFNFRVLQVVNMRLILQLGRDRRQRDVDPNTLLDMFWLEEIASLMR